MSKSRLRTACRIGVLGALLFAPSHAHALGNASTRFQVYVPPNAANSARPVVLVVTAVSPAGATVDIVDDAADGDSDDTRLGVSLQRGQSYLVWIKDGAVNDDAGGKRDGDYFRISADHPVVVEMATRSDWQHDWAASDGTSSAGTSFFIYAPPSTSSNNDINVFSYENGTDVTVQDVTVTAATTTGPTSVNLSAPQTILSATLDEGQDLIVRHGLGVDVLAPGHTYWVRATRPVTMQYGHLGSLTGLSQARDGGGFVPSRNGSSTGELFYFYIPYDPGRQVEKELRVVCYDAGSVVALSGWNATTNTWTAIAQNTVAAGGHLDFVGASNATFRALDLYRLTVNAGHRCVAFEANWLETGASGTSDIASSVASANGTNVGREFVTYLGPPGDQSAVPGLAGSYSHVYVYARRATTVTVKDVDTGGTKYTQTATIPAESYYDFRVGQAAYNSMNLPAQGLRPYVRVTASDDVAVISTNFNDNWMNYVYSVLSPEPRVAVSTVSNALACGAQTTVNLSCGNQLGSTLYDTSLSLRLPPNVHYVSGSATGAAPVGASSASGDTLTWTLGTLPTGGAAQLGVGVTFECAATSCPAETIAALSAECVGTASDFGGDPYASLATANVQLRPWQTNQLADLDAVPATGGGTNVTFTVDDEDGKGVYVIQRLASLAGTATTIAALPSRGVSSSPVQYQWRDTTAPAGATAFYRVLVQASGCTRTYGPASVYVTSASSSGANGGLESDGRLSSLLARRAIARSRNGTWPSVAESAQLETWHRTVQAISRTDLAAMVPAQGPADSTPVEATPTDLPMLTNAADVYSADYHDAHGDRVATVLILKTLGETYSHSKALCDRARGWTLRDVSEAYIDGGRGQLVRMDLADPQNQMRDYAVEFKLYAGADGRFQGRAAWLGADYPAPSTGQEVLNVQVWSRVPGYELALAESVIAGLDVTWDPPARLPEAWFSTAATRGSHVHGTLARRPDTEAAGLSLRATRILEDGSSVFDVRPLADLDAGLDLRLATFLDVTLEIVRGDGTVADRVWVSDGAWSAVDDSLAGGATRVRTFTSTACQPPAAAVTDDGAGDEAVRLAGCGGLAADVSQYAGVARHLGGGLAPLDLGAYKTMRFWLKSADDVRVCVEKQSQTGSAQPCTTVPAQPQGAFVEVALDALRAAPNCGQTALDDIDLVSFVVARPGAVELQVAGLSFLGRETHASAARPCVVATPGAAGATAGCAAAGPVTARAHFGTAVLAALGALVRRRRGRRTDRSGAEQ